MPLAGAPLNKMVASGSLEFLVAADVDPVNMFEWPCISSALRSCFSGELRPGLSGSINETPPPLFPREPFSPPAGDWNSRVMCSVPFRALWSWETHAQPIYGTTTPPLSNIKASVTSVLRMTASASSGHGPWMVDFAPWTPPWPPLKPPLAVLRIAT